jgi:hypothetical protein
MARNTKEKIHKSSFSGQNGTKRHFSLFLKYFQIVIQKKIQGGGNIAENFSPKDFGDMGTEINFFFQEVKKRVGFRNAVICRTVL